MKHTIRLIFLACLAGCGASEKGATGGRSAPPVKPEGALLQYRGQHGMRVSIARVSGPGVDALVQVTGIDTEIKNLVLPCTIEKNDRGFAYVTQFHGEDYWVVREETQGGVYIVLPEDRRVSQDLRLESDDKTEGLPKLLADFKAGYESGVLPKLAAWNPGERHKWHEEKLKEEFAEANKACKTTFNSTIDWDSVSDELLKEKSIYGYCENIADALQTMCERFPAAREEVKAFQEVRCTFKGDSGVRKDGNALVFAPNDTNVDKFAWQQLAVAMERAPTVFKGGQNYIIVDASDSDKPLYFGDGSTFAKHRRTENSSNWWSHYLFNGPKDGTFAVNEGGEWKLTCGNRSADFTELPLAERKKILGGATLKEYTFDREPFALARDDRGTYYYVDQRMRELGGKAYQVHIGKAGAVTTTDLKDIVDDSQGMIFSTKTGSLRLILSSDPMQASWVVGTKKPTYLTSLDIYGNPTLIYEKLGVYDKVDLGSICEKL